MRRRVCRRERGVHYTLDMSPTRLEHIAYMAEGEGGGLCRVNICCDVSFQFQVAVAMIVLKFRICHEQTSSSVYLRVSLKHGDPFSLHILWPDGCFSRLSDPPMVIRKVPPRKNLARLTLPAPCPRSSWNRAGGGRSPGQGYR